MDSREIKRQVFEDPTFGVVDPNQPATSPTLVQVLVELIDAINVFKDPTRFLSLLLFSVHQFIFGCFVVLVLFFTTWQTVIATFFLSIFMAYGVNTFWFHRYASHYAFRFSKPFFRTLFLWLCNVWFFREESYAIAHQIHHQISDQPGDLYGPHLGRFGNYVAVASIQRVRRDITDEQYQDLARRVQHIGFKMNSYEQFQKTGSVEQPKYFLWRMLFTQCFWGMIAWGLGGFTGFLVLQSSIFLSSSLTRDFNYWGHLGNKPVNSLFFAVIGGEWHENHHRFPKSANSGFLPGQIDIPFLMIKFLKRIGVVEFYYEKNNLQRSLERVNLAP